MSQQEKDMSNPWTTEKMESIVQKSGFELVEDSHYLSGRQVLESFLVQGKRWEISINRSKVFLTQTETGRTWMASLSWVLWNSAAGVT